MKRRRVTAMSHWKDFVTQLIIDEPTCYASSRKIHTNKSIEIPWCEFTRILPTIDLQAFGYAGWPAKEKQLDRNYFNEPELSKLNTIMRKRSGKGQSCVTARFGGPVAKGEDSMGYCMQTISLNYINKDTTGSPCRVIEVHWRATEILKKFVADMIYLQEKVFPMVLDGIPEPTAVRFHFQTIDVNPLYVNIMVQHLNLKKIYNGVKDRRWGPMIRDHVERLLTDGRGMHAYATLNKQYNSFKQYQQQLDEDEIKELCELLDIDYDSVKAFASTAAN